MQIFLNLHWSVPRLDQNFLQFKFFFRQLTVSACTAAFTVNGKNGWCWWIWISCGQLGSGRSWQRHCKPVFILDQVSFTMVHAVGGNFSFEDMQNLQSHGIHNSWNATSYWSCRTNFARIVWWSQNWSTDPFERQKVTWKGRSRLWGFHQKDNSFVLDKHSRGNLQP